MMIKLLISIVLIALGGCSCDREDEDYGPFPGGKSCDHKPKE